MRSILVHLGSQQSNLHVLRCCVLIRAMWVVKGDLHFHELSGYQIKKPRMADSQVLVGKGVRFLDAFRRKAVVCSGFPHVKTMGLA